MTLQAIAMETILQTIAMEMVIIISMDVENFQNRDQKKEGERRMETIMIITKSHTLNRKKNIVKIQHHQKKVNLIRNLLDIRKLMLLIQVRKNHM